jgi:hypothetical protein
MVSQQGTNTGPTWGPNTWSARGPMVPSRGQILALLRAYYWVGRKSNSTQQGNQNWPLLGAQHLIGSRTSNGIPAGDKHWRVLRAQHRVGRRSNSTQQGNQYWPLLGAQHLVSRKSNGTQQGTNTGPTWGPNTWSAGSTMVPSRGPILALLRAYYWVGRRYNSSQQGNQHWPLLGAHRLVGRRSNSTQQGTNTGPTKGLLLGRQEVQ